MFPIAPLPPQNQDGARQLLPVHTSDGDVVFADAQNPAGQGARGNAWQQDAATAGQVPAAMQSIDEMMAYGPEGTIIRHQRRAITFNSPEKVALRQQVAQLGDDNATLRQELSRAAQVVGEQQVLSLIHI